MKESQESISPDQPAKIGIILFPGINCENETKQVVDEVGMQGVILRWNQSFDPDEYAGYIIPGGWSYEDRIRAGAVSAKDTIMGIIKTEAKKGKPILGICNGCQVLIESNIVPETGFSQDKHVTEMAIAPNINKEIQGYFCTWVYVKLEQPCAFVSEGDKNKVLPIPIAHGEGRFMSSHDEIVKSIIDRKQIIMRYCDEKGDIINLFPVNPNGSFGNIAGMANKQGNVLALMPHPERAFWQKQNPHRKGELTYEELLAPGPGRLIFENMKKYIQRTQRTQTMQNPTKRGDS